MSSSPNTPQPTPPAPGGAPSPDPNNAPRGVPFDLSALDNDEGKPKWSLAWIALASALVLCCLFLWAYGLGARAQHPMPLGPVKTQNTGVATVRVYVDGAVVRPGVYALGADARVSDALASAGGLTPEGDPSSLNLAAFVQDGSKISVPLRVAATVAPIAPPVVPPVVAPPTNPSMPPQGVAPGTVSVPPFPATGTITAAQATRTATAIELRANPIDLNTATSEQLQTLPGVGPVMADRIITYRTINGRFKSVSDLDNVQGIGEKRMEEFKDMVVVR